MEQWLSYTKEFEAEIKILVCDRCHETPFPQIPGVVHSGISKTDGIYNPFINFMLTCTKGS